MTFKNGGFTKQTSTITIPATGHKYGTPTYTWSSDKSTCTAKRVCANNASHIETETVNVTSAITKEATCTETGTKTYTATFKNGAFAKQTNTVTIPALGHNFSTDYIIDKEPTHTEDGSKSQHCTRCGAKQNIITISATGHTYNAGVITKNPTCTEKGLKTYTCIGGDHTYTEEIPATGHKYGAPTYTWNNDKSICTAKRVCSIDGHVETETVNTTSTITKNATCTTTGTKTYTATFKNGAFAKQTSTTSIPAKGHHYVNGKCTECGDKDANYIEVGAQSTLDDWDYTLDKEKNIIHLINYRGSTKPNVVIYGRYEIRGKTYNTDLSNDISKRQYIFQKNAQSITSIVIKNGVSSTNCAFMFSECYNLKSLDVSGLDTSNVIDMQYMFNNCHNLTTLNLSNFDTSKVTNMTCMFDGDFKLTTLDVSSFNTSNVTNMSFMFDECSGIKSLNLINFDTSKTIQMVSMFSYCDCLELLDLSSFDTSKLISAAYMFEKSPKLQRIYVGDNWEIPSNCRTDDMFKGCGTQYVTHQ